MTEKALELEPGENERVMKIVNTIVREAQTLSPNGRKALVVCIFRRFKDAIEALNTKKEGVKP